LAGLFKFARFVASGNTYEKPSAPGRIQETHAAMGNGWISLKASMRVPFVTSPQGTVFIWPGLQPDGLSYFPIGNGVLQPVLTYGSSCAPNPTKLVTHGWWISGQYVNTDKDPNAKGGPFHGCYPTLKNSGLREAHGERNCRRFEGSSLSRDSKSIGTRQAPRVLPSASGARTT
jgi:hypothetical protein